MGTSGNGGVDDMATLAAHPRECCLQTVQHTGKPTGVLEEVAGATTYVARPPGSSAEDKHARIVLYYPDVFGPLYVNNQLLIDYFASHGYLIAAPDYFDGDDIQELRSKPDFDMSAWGAKKRTRAKALLPDWTGAIKSKYGTDVTKYTAVGYCFGAPYALEAGATDLVVASAIAHPSSISEDHFKNIKKPLFLSCAEVDRQFPPEARHRAEAILAEQKSDYHFQLFGGVSHGFAVKGDPNVPNEKYAKEESARGIIGWFDRFTN
ncbi:alpha/beta-hydrolase [Gloeopeniophorella convolvens]|nr:alpha/beta-hydrolase [Gloeopeniophorella convolvens]